MTKRLQTQHWLRPHSQGEEKGQRGKIKNFSKICDKHWGIWNILKYLKNIEISELYSNIWKICSQVASMVLVGDARGKVAILVDDMADTCGTIVQVPQFCLEYLVLVFPSLLTTSDTCSIIARNISLCLRSWSWCQLGWQDEDQDQQHYHFGLCPLMSALFSVFILALTIPPITCTTDNKS